VRHWVALYEPPVPVVAGVPAPVPVEASAPAPEGVPLDEEVRVDLVLALAPEPAVPEPDVLVEPWLLDILAAPTLAGPPVADRARDAPAPALGLDEPVAERARCWFAAGFFCWARESVDKDKTSASAANPVHLIKSFPTFDLSTVISIRL